MNPRSGFIGDAIKSAKQARKMLLSYMEGLEPEDFRWRPAKGANPILNELNPYQ